MKLGIKNRKLKRALEGEVQRKKCFGEAMARKIKLRVDALNAAESLADFWPPLSGPERCHRLKGNLADFFSVDVKQPYRLLFKPVSSATGSETKDEMNAKDEKQRWLAIREIEIIDIEDTHV